MARALDFATDGRDWPNRTASRFLRAGGINWHLQEMGPADDTAPVIWLLHGTGASTHSWRDLIPELASNYRVFAPDLPGHGFTGHPPGSQLSLRGMAMLVARLIDTVGTPPDIIVGHSAGVAIAVRMVLDDAVHPDSVVSLAGALMPMGGQNSNLMSLAAKMLAVNPLIPRIFAWRSRDQSVVQELLDRTGSVIDEEGLRCYSMLAQTPAHAKGALTMMANWNLRHMAQDLRSFTLPLLLVTGEKDKMIPARDTALILELVPSARPEPLAGLGHLAHEEAPAKVAGLIRKFATESEN